MNKIIQLHPQEKHDGQMQTVVRDCLVTENTTCTFTNDDSGNPHGMKISTMLYEGNPRTVWYTSAENRGRDHRLILAAKNGGWKMLEGVKKYVAENRDVIYTIAFVAVIDQLLFEGAFRERLKALVEGFLKKAETAQSKPAAV